MRWTAWLTACCAAAMLAVETGAPLLAQYPGIGFGRPSIPTASQFSSGRFANRFSRPTVSPWLNLYRRDPGPLGPYLSYVLPQQRLQSTITSQQYMLRSQQFKLQTLGRQVRQLQQGGQGLLPTGVGASFMNYSHYFPSVR